MRSRLTTTVALAVVAIFVQGCNLSPTSPNRSAAPGDEPQSAAFLKGKPHGSPGTFDLVISGDVTGSGTGYISEVGEATSDLVIGQRENGANQVFLTFGPAIDPSGCFSGSLDGVRHFRIKQNQPTNSPAEAEVDYYFDVDGVRYRIFFFGSFNPATPYWVSALDPSGGVNTIIGNGVEWTINKVKGKGSKQPCASGLLSYMITVTRTS